MTLPSSGTISLGQIATEFSDSQPNSMSEFYRNGSLVPSSKTVTQSLRRLSLVEETVQAMVMVDPLVALAYIIKLYFLQMQR